DDEEPEGPNDDTGPVAVEGDKIGTDEPVDDDHVSQAAEDVGVTTEVLPNEANEKPALAAEAPITFASHGIDIAPQADDAPAKARPTPSVVDPEPEDQTSESSEAELEAIDATPDAEPEQADDDRAREVTMPPVSREVLADLVRRDLVGIAAEAA
ncbi:hypothetical protein ACFHWW_34255, partial [Ensifer sp. P24N7]|uniref:hypothetical protein n=1 Tax=Sinorhizobium sp. P24N7 TaxID=3348358 RepID=UPI0035F31987